MWCFYQRQPEDGPETLQPWTPPPSLNTAKSIYDRGKSTGTYSLMPQTHKPYTVQEPVESLKHGNWMECVYDEQWHLINSIDPWGLWAASDEQSLLINSIDPWDVWAWSHTGVKMALTMEQFGSNKSTPETRFVSHFSVWLQDAADCASLHIPDASTRTRTKLFHLHT